MTMKQDLPVLAFDDRAAWESWLETDGAHAPGLWMRLAKAGAPRPTIGKNEAIEAALCHGWIDGQLAGFDEHYFLVRFTRRRPGSRWSAMNRDAARRLIEAGRMSATGLREVEAARADGRWDAAYAPQSRAEPPPDLLAALAANPAAARGSPGSTARTATP